MDSILLNTLHCMKTYICKYINSESGYADFDARYYTDNLMMWLNVDPMSDKYPSMSPYMYCAGNPIKFSSLAIKNISLRFLR